jgi:hypothetical protein
MFTTPGDTWKARAGMSGTSMNPHLWRVSTAAHTSTGPPVATCGWLIVCQTHVRVHALAACFMPWLASTTDQGSGVVDLCSHPATSWHPATRSTSGCAKNTSLQRRNSSSHLVAVRRSALHREQGPCMLPDVCTCMNRDCNHAWQAQLHAASTAAYVCPAVGSPKSLQIQLPRLLRN